MTELKVKKVKQSLLDKQRKYTKNTLVLLTKNLYNVIILRRPIVSSKLPKFSLKYLRFNSNNTNYYSQKRKCNSHNN